MKAPETQLPPEKGGLASDLYLTHREQCYNEELKTHRKKCYDLRIVLRKAFSCATWRAKTVAVSPRGHGKVFSEGASIMRCCPRCSFNTFYGSPSKEALLSMISACLLFIPHFCVSNGLAHRLAKHATIFILYFLPHCKGRRAPQHFYANSAWSRTMSTVSVDLQHHLALWLFWTVSGSEDANSNIRLPAAVLPEEFSSKSFPISLIVVIFQPQAKSISGWNLHLGKQHSNVRAALINKSDSIFYTNVFQVYN